MLFLVSSYHLLPKEASATKLCGHNSYKVFEIASLSVEESTDYCQMYATQKLQQDDDSRYPNSRPNDEKDWDRLGERVEGWFKQLTGRQSTSYLLVNHIASVSPMNDVLLISYKETCMYR